MTKRREQRLFILTFLGPPLAIYAIFVLLPAFNAFRYSLMRWDGLSAPGWVGLKNFRTMLASGSDFLPAIGHNLFLTFVPGVITLSLALFFAYMIHLRVRGARLFRIAFFFPNVISSVAVALLWVLIYSTTDVGLLNNLLKMFGHKQPIPFTASAQLLWSIVPMMVWSGTGFYMVLFLAAMENIPETFYEAARLDGATTSEQFRFITLPLMWDVLTTGIIFLVVGGLKFFDAIWVMENGRPSPATHTMSTLMYSKVFSEYNVGYGTAIAVLLFVLVLLATLISFRLLKRERLVLMGRKMQGVGVGLRYALLTVWLIAVFFPMLWVLFTSAKSTQEIYQNPFGLPRVLTAPNHANIRTLVGNYHKAWVGSKFSRYFLNSIKVVGISLALILWLGSMAAYVLARFEFRGRQLIYYLFLGGLLIPMQLILIPLFFQFSDMGEAMTRLFAPPVRALGLGTLTISLHDSHAGLILIYVAASLPFTVFTLTAFFRTLPNEVREAARMDGASEYRTFFSIMMPLAKPGLVTVAIFNFLGLWNEYMFGLVFLSNDDLKTLPLGLASISMQAQYKSDFGLLFAGLVITMLPTLIVYLIMQEKLTKGITVGAIKG